MNQAIVMPNFSPHAWRRSAQNSVPTGPIELALVWGSPTASAAVADALRALAAELIGCDKVRAVHDGPIAKPAHGPDSIPWHRDLPNWPVAEPGAVSCWLALDEVTAEAGATRFTPGGHKEPMTRSIDFLSGARSWGDRERDAVPVPGPASPAIFRNNLAWHTSPPNGALFNEDTLPTLGPDLPLAPLSRMVGGAA